MQFGFHYGSNLGKSPVKHTILEGKILICGCTPQEVNSIYKVSRREDSPHKNHYQPPLEESHGTVSA